MINMYVKPEDATHGLAFVLDKLKHGEQAQLHISDDPAATAGFKDEYRRICFALDFGNTVLNAMDAGCNYADYEHIAQVFFEEYPHILPDLAKYHDIRTPDELACQLWELSKDLQNPDFRAKLS